MLGASIGFLALLAGPRSNHRFRWSTVPRGVVVAGDVLVASGFYLISRVNRANTFTSATIEVVENQRVISTGPYAIVRHPMYASASLYLFGTPLALGLYWGFVPIAAMMPFLIWRLVDEERFLARNLRDIRNISDGFHIVSCHSYGEGHKRVADWARPIQNR
jgi:protein-S-isoprenylcysteine O-methyltransferase Ste14